MPQAQTDDEKLGRTHITGYDGWPPPQHVLKYLQTFSSFANSHFKSGTLLDLGCGDGSIDRLIAEANPDLKIVAADLEPHPQWEYKKPKNLSFATASVYHLPYKSSSFDYVMMKDMLHHVPEPSKALENIAGIAKKQVLVIEANRYNPISYVRMVKMAKHEHFSRRELEKIIGRPAKIYTIESHVWPGKLNYPGKIIDASFSLRPLSRLRNYNLALFAP